MFIHRGKGGLIDYFLSCDHTMQEHAKFPTPTKELAELFKNVFGQFDDRS